MGNFSLFLARDNFFTHSFLQICTKSRIYSLLNDAYTAFFFVPQLQNYDIFNLKIIAQMQQGYMLSMVTFYLSEIN